MDLTTDRRHQSTVNSPPAKLSYTVLLATTDGCGGQYFAFFRAGGGALPEPIVINTLEKSNEQILVK